MSKLDDRDTVDSGAFCASSLEESAWALQLMLGDGSEAGSSASELGRLHFSVSYDFNKRSLVVEIHEAENLPAMDRNGLSDPYVKV